MAITHTFSNGITLLKNEEDWKILDGDSYLSDPLSYPCLAIGPTFVYDDNGPDKYYYHFVYPQDAQNLITEYWEQKE